MNILNQFDLILSFFPFENGLIHLVSKVSSHYIRPYKLATQRT